MLNHEPPDYSSASAFLLACGATDDNVDHQLLVDVDRILTWAAKITTSLMRTAYVDGLLYGVVSSTLGSTQ